MRKGVYVGYNMCNTDLTGDGDWGPHIERKPCKATILKALYNQQSENQVNDDFVSRNRISIVANKFARTHKADIKYVEWEGTRWKVTSVEVDQHRMILSLGGVWSDNEET